MRHFHTIFSVAIGILLGFSTVDAREVLVGVEMPLSGSYARAGKGNLEGITVAAEVFNRQNAKHKIKLVTIDDESSPAKAIAAVEKLAAQGVVAITGGYTTTICGAASTAADKAGLVYMTTGSPSSELGERGLKTFFRINNSDGYLKAMTGLFGDMKIKSLSIITTTQQATAEVANNVKKALEIKGVKVTLHSFDPGITDFKPIVNKVKLQDRPDVIFMAGLENDYVGILRAAKVLKPNVKAMVGVWSLATPKMATDFPDLMPNVYGTAMLPYPTEFRSAAGKEFEEAFTRLYSRAPDYLAQLGYVQGQVLFEAIKQAEEKGTLAKGGLANELRKTSKETLIGLVTFDEKGENPNFRQWMGQHQNGRIVIVWPKEYANGRMNYPALPW
jgi:branched-chain amino acid transport system substrate-binding protein